MGGASLSWRKIRIAFAALKIVLHQALCDVLIGFVLRDVGIRNFFHVSLAKSDFVGVVLNAALCSLKLFLSEKLECSSNVKPFTWARMRISNNGNSGLISAIKMG